MFSLKLSRGLSLVLAAALVALATTVSAQMVEETTAADIPPPPIRGQNVDGMHIYIRTGLKTHGEGRHDYPQLLADWSKILTEQGAVVDGSLHFPSAEELEGIDVILMYKGDAGYMDAEERAIMDAYVQRGGGIVTIHDVLCGPDPAHFATLVGGGKKHGDTNFSSGAITYDIVDPTHPIMQGIPQGFTIQDEAFYDITWAQNPGVHVLATAPMPPSRSAGEHAGEVVPQIWTYEHSVQGGQSARAFVWMQGHLYTNIAMEPIRSMLLRGIAWAGHRPVNELVDYVAPADDD